MSVGVITVAQLLACQRLFGDEILAVYHAALGRVGERAQVCVRVVAVDSAVENGYRASRAVHPRRRNVPGLPDDTRRAAQFARTYDLRRARSLKQVYGVGCGR